MEAEPRPRLCFLTRGERGYGFHLHGERSRGGQFIRRVEPGSSADMAGLRAGDRVVEVNGENVENDSHHKVVDRIREVPHRARLLVVDRDTDDYLRARGLECTEDLALVMGTLSPRPSPGPTPSVSPVPRVCSPPVCSPPAPRGEDTWRHAAAEAETASVTSGSTTDAEVEASPEPSAELLPRLCQLVKGENGYGFNLHSNKNTGAQLVRSVDPGSPAEASGVRPGDRLLEVNGVSIEALRHSEVVSLIRSAGEDVRLLVVDPETDELFLRLGITPTGSHVKEVYIDESPAEAACSTSTSSQTSDLHAVDAPVIQVTRTGSPDSDASPKQRANRSSASQSSHSSTTQSEISSSDMSIQVADEDDRRVSDPFTDSLRLSPTAAEAKMKVLAGRKKKSAPPMDWSKKQEVFSNF